MMKLIIFGIFYTILSVQSRYDLQLIVEGDPFTYVCDEPSASWDLYGYTFAAYCKSCPSLPCIVKEDYKERITAFCDKTNPVFHLNSAPAAVDFSYIRCPQYTSSPLHYILVGRYDGRLHSENNSTVALEQNDFTLVFDRRLGGGIYWLDDQGAPLREFHVDCSKGVTVYERQGFNITCDEKTSKLHIKNVTLTDDGRIFACSEGHLKNMSLFKLTVNVPVTSVSLQPQSQVLVENEESLFVCKVEESKPEASFEWIIVYQNGSSQEIHQKSTALSKTIKGKLWQTNSTLKVKLTRDSQKIMCKATIENLPWTNSDYQSLDIKVPVTSVSIQPQSQVLFEYQDVTFVCQVEESNPEASFEWIIVYHNGSSEGIHQDSTTTKTLKGNVWQTNSTLKLNPKRYYEKIMCKATITNLPWTKSEYQSLDIMVPVTSVYIQAQSHVLVENEEAMFICIVEESNPEASFEWIIVYQDESSQEIYQNSTTISKKLKGKMWQTNSTLKLNLTNNFQKIMCKATIESLPWKNSEYQSLDMKNTNISDTKISDTTISTGATIVSCVIAVIIVSIIIFGGFLYFKYRRPSRQEDELQLTDTELTSKKWRRQFY